MALALDQLVFSVDSTQLDEARIKIAKLGDAVAALNKPLQDMSRSSAKTNEVVAKSELAAEKARVATKALADTTGQVKEKVDPLAKLIEKLSNNYTDMASGFTKGESSILNQARNLGIFGSELQPVIALLEKIKTLNKDPFDASLGGVRSITQEFEKLQQRANLAAQGIMLTSKQLGEYSKLAAEAAGKVEGMGFDPKSGEGLNKYNQLLAESQNKYLEIVASVNKLTQAEKDRNDALKQQERLLASNKAISDAMIREVAGQVGQKSPELQQMAEFYKKQELAARQLTAAEDDLILREQKLAFVNKELAAGLSTASANALFKYQKDLEALGKSAEEVSRRMTAFRAGLVERQSHSPFTKLTQEAETTNKRLDHLSRALGPQITDIFVGLATGQSLLTVALQQGGQIRDQIALAGVASSDMGKALSTAAVQMVASLKDVAVAMGSLLITPFIAGGKAVTDFATKIVFANKTIQAYSLALALYADNGNKLASGVINVMSKIPMLIGASFAAATLAVTSLTVAFFVAQKELDNLSKQLILTGGSLGLNRDSALDYAKALDGVSGSTSQVIAVIQAMAKQGGFLREEISLVTKSAIELEKYAGVSIEDTVKAFAKLKEEPVKALLELAKQTGMVSAETLNMVVTLEKQGSTSQAAAIAVKALADVNSEQVDRMKRDYSSLGLTLIEVGDWFANLWRQAKGVVYEPTAMEQAVKALQQADVALTEAQKSLNSSENLSIRPSTQAIDILRQRLDARKNEYVQLIKNQQAENQSRINNVAIADAKKRSLDLEASAMSPIEKAKANIAKYTGEIAKAEQLVASTKDEQVIKDTLIGNLKKSIAKENENIAKENKRNNADQLNEAKKIENFGKKALEESRKYLAGERAEVEQTTEAWKRYLKIEEADFWTKIPESLKEQIRLNYQLADAEERMREQRAKAQEEFMKNFGEIARLNSETYRKNTVSIQQAKEEADSIKYQASLIGLSSEEREKLLALKKIDLQTEKDINELVSKGIPLNATVIQQTRDLGQLQKDNVQAMLDLKQYEKLMSELGDVMFLALTNRGAQAGKKLRDLIKAKLMEPITLVINAVIGEVFGGAIASMLSAVGIKAPAGFNLGTVGSIAKGVSAAKDIYATANGGFTPVGVGVSASFNKFAVSSFGEKLGLSQQVQVPVTDISATGGAPVTETVSSTQMTELGNSMSASLGQIATSTASLVAGAAMRKMFSGGYSMGNSMETAQGIAMAAAEFFFPGIGGAVAGAVSGLMNRAFGHKLKEVGIVGTFGGDQGFVGQQYKYEKGGWFSDDKTSFSALEQKTTNSLTTSFRAIQIAVGTLATSLGVSTDSIEKFTYDMKLNLKGLSDLDIQKQITAEFTNMQEQMSQGVLRSWAKTKIDPKIQQEIDDATTRLVSSSSWWGKRSINKEITTLKNKLTEQADDVWKSLLRAVDDKGTMETAVQLLERLSNTLATVNGSLDTLGYSLLQLSIDSAILAINLTDAFGGVDEFSKSMSYFYNNFYTEQEKTTTLTRQLTTAFAKLGYELPKTTYEFRDLMQAAIEGGDYGLAASLGKLQTSFIELTGPVGQLEEKFKQLSSGLLEEVNRLRGAVISDVSLSGGIPGLTAEFAMLTAQAKSGNTTALEKLPEYSQAIEQAVAASAVNASDVAYARAWLAESLGNTSSILNGTDPSLVSSSASFTQDVSTPTVVNGAAVITASTSSQADLIAALVAEVQGLRAEVRADVAANNKTAKILERANQDGETISVSVVA